MNPPQSTVKTVLAVFRVWCWVFFTLFQVGWRLKMQMQIEDGDEDWSSVYADKPHSFMYYKLLSAFFIQYPYYTLKLLIITEEGVLAWPGSVSLVHSAFGFYFEVEQCQGPVSTWMGDHLSTRLQLRPAPLTGRVVELASWYSLLGHGIMGATLGCWPSPSGMSIGLMVPTWQCWGGGVWALWFLPPPYSKPWKRFK